MIKTITHILIILAVIAAVAGGIYLLVQNNGTTLLSNFQDENGIHEGNGFRPEGGNFNKGQPPSGDQHSIGNGFERERDSGGFSARSLAELGVSFGKIALITIGVVLVQGLSRFFRRRKHPAAQSAV